MKKILLFILLLSTLQVSAQHLVVCDSIKLQAAISEAIKKADTAGYARAMADVALKAQNSDSAKETKDKEHAALATKAAAASKEAISEHYKQRSYPVEGGRKIWNWLAAGICILIVVFMIVIMKALSKSKFSLNNALSENTSAGSPPVASASRLIAFISAVLLFIVGIAATCFFLYFYLVNGVAPDLSNLSAVLIALGIGMAPYALNKVSK